MGARDAIARLRRTQVQPSAWETPPPPRIIGHCSDAPIMGQPPLDYAEDPQPFEAQPMFGLCETILIGGMAVSLGAVLIWHVVRLWP